MIPKAYQCVMRGQNPKWPLCPKRKTPLLPYIVLNNEVSQFMITQYRHIFPAKS